MKETPPSISDSDWRHTPPAVQALVVNLLQAMERGAHLEQVVEQQAARIASLETELARRKGRGSRSAQASSSESASQASRRTGKRRSSGRSPGGQPGHEGHGRSLVPVEQVDELVPIKPSTCHRCGQALSGNDPHPLRHQEVVIPPVRAQVIEYQFHTLRCRHCDILTEAPWPEGVSRRTFGPSVQAWVGLLSGAYRLSKRNIVALLSDAFGVHLCPGTVSQLEQEVSAGIAEPVDAARAYVRQQPTVNLDETGWRERRLRAWLWVVITAGVSVFAIRRCRGREVVDELLGDNSTAIVGSDRFSAYGHLPVSRRQVCWAHLRRTFEDFVARGGEAARVGEKLLEYTAQLFTWWHRIRDGTLQLSSFQVYVSRHLRFRVRFELWYGQQFADAKTAATCGNLLAIEPALWTFVRKNGDVEPTNNAAERGLRHGVLWRLTSFGTHSPDGSRFVERMLTVRDTLRRQERHVLDYLTTACYAALYHQPAPSLLPQDTAVSR